MSQALPVVDVGRPTVGVPLGRASAAALVFVSVFGVAAFTWPLWIGQVVGSEQQVMVAPFVLAATLPLLVLLALAMVFEGGLDSRTLAVLGVLSALNAAIRLVLSAGTAGFESVFFLLILAGRVFGPGFGFLLGCTSLFASALLTGGVGPWLPYQMLASAWIGMGAGLLPRRIGARELRGPAEIALLIGYGIVVSYLYGIAMNLWSWPFLAGVDFSGMADRGLDFLPGGFLGENLVRFGWYTLITSTGSWDTGRAIATTLGLALFGSAVLAVLRRVNHQR